MKLFTVSGIKVNVIKLTNVFTNANEWDPHAFMIDNIPMTAFTAPTGKASQYRFMWNGQYYRLSKKVTEALPEGERMKFFTIDPTVKLQEVKKKLRRAEGNLFITIIQFPDIKGLFVGTVLRACINDDGDAICDVRNNKVTISRDYYRHASSIEIFSYFSSHFNKLVIVKVTNNDSGEIRELVNIIEGVSGNIFARTSNQEKSEEVALSYVYDPTDVQLLQYYMDAAASKQFTPGSFVIFKGNTFEIKSFKLSSRQQLEVVIERDDKQIVTSLQNLSLVYAVLPTSNGLDLANHFIDTIDKNRFLENLDKQVAKSFFIALKIWCENHLNS